MSLTIKTAIAAGQTVKFTEYGNFVRVMSADAPLTVRTYRNGAVLADSPEVGAGFAEEFESEFHETEIYSATAQEIQIVIRLASKVYFDTPPVGNVQIVGEQGAFTQSRASVTNAAAVLLAANAARRYLMIQNNDPAATLRITLDGSAPAAGAGFRILPGESMELAGFMTNGAINAIMETATATADNVEVCEG